MTAAAVEQKVALMLSNAGEHNQQAADVISGLPEFPAQQVVDDVRVGLDQAHQDLLLQLCRHLQGHTRHI